MTARLRSSHIVLAGLGAALATITACSAPTTATEKDAQSTAQASSVVVDMKSASGDYIGTCSGTLIGPKTVLTAGHCIAGAKQWSVTSSAGSAKGTVASTPWKAFGSTYSHPDYSDVGLITLTSPIKLDSYPQLSTKGVKDGATATRFHRATASAKDLTATAAVLKDGADQGFKLNYVLTLPKSESFVDAGGAVMDSAGKIVGVVSGKGVGTDMLHVARVDGYSTWSQSAVACANALKAADWGSGNSDNGGGGYGGVPAAPAPAGGGGGGWNPWGGGGGSTGVGTWNTGAGGSAWGSSSGGYGGGGGVTTNTSSTTNPDGTVPGSGTTPSGTTSPGDGTTTPTTPTAPTTTDNGNGTAPSDQVPNTCPGVPSCEGDNCGPGSDGNNGGTGNDATPQGPGGPVGCSACGASSTTTPATPSGPTTTTNPDGTTTTTSTDTNGVTTSVTTNPSDNSTTTTVTTPNPDGTKTSVTTNPDGTKTTTTVPAGTTPSSSVDHDHCEGSLDNVETCPPSSPDSASCSDGTCGGCGVDKSCSDNNVDYGDCSACAASGGVTNNPK